jgi:16S rRNA (uracil1498-N3)-methyltransferase
VAHAFADQLDDVVVIAGDDGHHLQRVRRIRAGEPLTVADGRGTWRPYAVTRADPGRLVLTAAGETRVEPVLVPSLGVAFSLGKGTKPETIVAALTELGVDRIVPFRSARSVVRWEGERAVNAVARLRRVAREAAMQSRRARIPDVEDVADFERVAVAPGLVMGDPAGRPLDGLSVPAAGEWLAVVGAEGGLDHAERDRLVGVGAAMVAIGPYVLRTETAAVALASALATRRRARDRHGA